MIEKIEKERIKKYLSKIVKVVGGFLLTFYSGYLLHQCQYNMEREKDKINLFVETKAIFDQLHDEYKQLINGKIGLLYYGTMLRNDMATRTYSFYDKKSEMFMERSQSEDEENKKN